MATKGTTLQQSSTDDAKSSNGPPSKLIVVTSEMVWDPLSSPDWDKESHTREAIVRIKR